jgi:hypothetical protein
MGLRTDAVDGNAGCDPLLDVGGETLGLGVAGGVQVVIVDVKFGSRVNSTRSVEGEGNKILAQNIVEYRGAETSIFGYQRVSNYS